ncbi:MAG: cell wall metabolism sensor histidine kinase WalK [Anaeromicrobium sp.]|jgi:signal transduction histidine kinase|uniref:sensor histidine kinase n=1 Tax=Anaeromicrobium sp. TaxID=1929132 RepID=UPI0025D34D7B|nr:HAMP domain-containing sensor histidine kinase [Anaeromicrobium sp.]MCT4594335.1 cell wall metabolism sensor histidine kinase WalK [Anaeromicrobium sp.]
MKNILSKLWIFITSLILIILGISWIFQVYFLDDFYIDAITNSLIDSGKEIATIVEKEGIDSHNLSKKIHEVASDLNGRVNIIDRKSNVIYNNLLGERGLNDLRILGKKPPPRFERFSFKQDLYVNRLIQKKNGKNIVRHLNVALPIKKGDKVVGNVWLSSGLSSTDSITFVLKKQLSIISGISLLVGTILSLFLSKMFAKPIIKITHATKEIAKGNFHYNINVKGKDEIGILGNTINKMAEQLSQTETFRREFIANTSHELKTPISLIKAYAELTLDIEGEEKENREGNLKVIIDESDRLTNMVEDILYLSKMEAGYYDPTMETFLVNDTLNRVIYKLKYFAKEKNINILFNPNKDLIIEGDENKIFQVFFNILNNSIIHSFNDSEIQINLLDNKDSIKIEFKDFGSGIPKEDLPHIWERFYKVDKSRKRDKSGTGLGMSIVKNILEAHNYSYGVESEVNKGTLVWIEVKK